MALYEYKVVPAPQKGLRAKGVKTADGKFANALESALNTLAQDGWEYQRAETLPSEERSGLTSKTTAFRNVLIFRRSVDMQSPTESPAEEQMPESLTPQPITEPTPPPEDSAPDDSQTIPIPSASSV